RPSCVSFAGFDAAVPDRAMLVGRFDAVPGIACLVQRYEKLLRVAVESALASLIGIDFDESVVPAFLPHAQLQGPQITGESSRARGMTTALHSDLGKEFVRDTQHVHRYQLRSKKMSHRLLSAWFRSRKYSLNPVHALERHPLVFLAAELDRRRPISGRGEEETAGISTELLFLLEAVACVGAIRAGRENPSFASLDRLLRLLVHYHHPEHRRLQRAGRLRIKRHAEFVGVRPQTRSLRRRPASGERKAKQGGGRQPGQSHA